MHLCMEQQIQCCVIQLECTFSNTYFNHMRAPTGDYEVENCSRTRMVLQDTGSSGTLGHSVYNIRREVSYCVRDVKGWG
jgi:hypothetical protein